MGYGIIELGSVAQIAAGLGRTMSPVAAAAIICAKFAGINPMGNCQAECSSDIISFDCYHVDVALII